MNWIASKGLLIFFVFFLSSCVLDHSGSRPTSYWIWGNMIPKRVSHEKDLYVYQGIFDVVRGKYTYHFEGLSPRPIDKYSGKLTLTYRLEKLIPPSIIVSRFVSHQKAWRRHNIVIDGIQIDYDSPTKKLLEYADWLALLKKEIKSDVSISITGLGDWLASAPSSHLNNLSEKTSFIAFMMYHGGHPLKNTSHYIEYLENLTIPFKIGRLEKQTDTNTFKSIVQAQSYKGEIIFIPSGGNQIG